MKRLIRLALLILTASVTARAAETPLKFARYPAPSPQGKQVAFSYQGDIWIAPLKGGDARRITVHEAYDSRPVWSPDGKRIAFQSDRNGNLDVYIVGTEGGGVSRLTHHGAPDTICAWTPDGERVLFTSHRPHTCFVRPILFSVS
ncbi:MAG: S41 family peptidase, partial [Planctomycetota bacterium]